MRGLAPVNVVSFSLFFTLLASCAARASSLVETALCNVILFKF